jgi:uncharacterized protein involved in cysteine biosynthesis
MSDATQRPGRPGFFFGFALPSRALTLLLSDRHLLGLALLPFLLGVGLSVWLGKSLNDLLYERATGVLAHFGFEATGLLGALLGYLIGFLALLSSALLLPFVNSLAAVPFNDFLAEATETRARPPLAPVPGPNLGQRMALIWMDLAKTGAALLVTLPLLVLSFVPGAQIVCFPLLWLLYAFQMLSFPQTRRAEGVGDAVRFIRANLGACLGFGFAHALIGIVPLVSHLGPPLAVVGGTLLYARAVAAR